MDRFQRMLSFNIIPTGGRCADAARRCFQLAIDQAKLCRDDVQGIVSTGYGRKTVPFASEQITEITCHAKGVHCLFPKTSLIIDIGGQDSKAISIDKHGNVCNFIMNDKCAAGTGRFLEVMARVLELDFDQMNKLHQKAEKLVNVNSFCTVFAESEVISLIAEGNAVSDIVKGINASIASKITGLGRRISHRNDEVTFTGGVAKNKGVVFELKKLMSNEQINIPEEPQITGAIGAALLALENCGHHAR